MSNPSKYRAGDIVRHATKFLQSVQWYTDVPINGRVLAVRQGKYGAPDVLRVEWSDGHEASILASNVELDPRSKKNSPQRRRDAETPFLVGDRVELHPATDRWMMGDRYGEVVYVNTKKGTATVLLDKSGKRLRFLFTNLMSTDPQARLEGREVGHRNNPKARTSWRERLIDEVREDKQRGAITWGEYSDLYKEIHRAKSQSEAENIVRTHRRMRAWNPGGATGKQKVFAKSEYRYRASASERRLYGGSTVTQFLVGYEGSEPSTWMNIMGYGPTPGERKTYAIKKFLEAQDDPTKKTNKGRGRKASPFRRGR